MRVILDPKAYCCYFDPSSSHCPLPERDVPGLLMGQSLFSLLSFLCISVASSYIFFRLRVPAGTIIGPIFVITVIQTFGFRPEIPAHTDTVLISVFGVYFATRMRGVIGLKGTALFAPLLVTVVWFIAQAFFASFVLRKLTDIESINSYLAVIPGGIAEMNIVTLSYGANVTIINAFHLARLFSIILFVPAILRAVYRETIDRQTRVSETFFPTGCEPIRWAHVALMFSVGAVGSIVFIVLGVPAGGLMGALFFVIVFEVLTRIRATPPKRLSVVIVSVLGGTIGLNVDIEVFRSATQLLLPVVVITFITLAGAAILALLIHRLFRRDYLPTLLGVIPGGLAVMMSIAESVTDDLFYVTSLQTVRLLTAVVLLPNLLLVTGIIVPL